MKIKNTEFYQAAASVAVTAAVIVGTIACNVVYYNQETVSQVSEANNNQRPVFTGEDGKVYSYFYIGEHKITISRNDKYHFETEEIEEYTISKVETTNWKDNCKITYVNTVPVVVEASKTKDGKYQFNTFGVVQQPKEKVK